METFINIQGPLYHIDIALFFNQSILISVAFIYSNFYSCKLKHDSSLCSSGDFKAASRLKPVFPDVTRVQKSHTCVSVIYQSDGK